ncbi:MAG: hypothetical protein CMD08_01400 [Flavobacteriales bacterium]|nr:hypothetical protein [Flavobacteriales bacterium]
MRENQDKKKRQLKSYAHYSSLVIQMACIIILGAFIGDYIDAKNSLDKPVYTIIFSLVSIFLSLYYVFNKIKGLK